MPVETVARERRSPPETGEAGESGLIRPPAERAIEAVAAKLPLGRIATLPVQVDVCVPLPDFRVADLLLLAPGSVLATEWASTEDVPLRCGDVHLLWTEFEVVDQTLAVRVTRLA